MQSVQLSVCIASITITATLSHQANSKSLGYDDTLEQMFRMTTVEILRGARIENMLKNDQRYVERFKSRVIKLEETKDLVLFLNYMRRV